MRHSRFISFSLIFLFSAPASLANNTQLNLSISQQQAMGIKTSEAIRVNQVPSSVYPAQGSIPLQSIRSLSSPLDGQIIKLNYVHGPIKKEQIIAEIESPELLKIQEELLATLSDVKIANQSLKRAKTLNKSGVSSTKKLQQAISEVKKLTLKKNQLRQKLLLVGMAASAIEKLQKTETLQPAILQLRSPIDGQLFDLQVRLGERVAQNQTLISLGENNPLILMVHVPIKVANTLSIEQAVEVKTINRIGRIKHIDPLVDPMTQSVDVHISIENNDGKLRVGQLFKIRFLSHDSQNNYQVPASAISHYQGEAVLFIKTKQGSIQVLEIEVLNIANGQLYFIPKQPVSSPLNVYSNGSGAIKSALEAKFVAAE